MLSKDFFFFAGYISKGGFRLFFSMRIDREREGGGAF